MPAERFDVSAQYRALRGSLVRLTVMAGAGGVVVEILAWLWIRKNAVDPLGPAALGLLALVGVVFGGLLAYVLALLRRYGVQTIVVDEIGLRLLRDRWANTDYRWSDPGLHLTFRAHAPAQGLRPEPPPEFVYARAPGFPQFLEVPYPALQRIVVEAAQHSLSVREMPATHRGRFGPHHYWVTEIAAPVAR